MEAGTLSRSNSRRRKLSWNGMTAEELEYGAVDGVNGSGDYEGPSICIDLDYESASIGANLLNTDKDEDGSGAKDHVREVGGQGTATDQGKTANQGKTTGQEYLADGAISEVELSIASLLPEGGQHADETCKSTQERQQRRADGKLRSFGSRVSTTQQGWFTLYKRLFLLSLLLNLCILLAASLGQLAYAQKRAALFSVGNILAVVLCRSEAFLRVIFMLAVVLLGCRTPWGRRVPLRLKVYVTAFLQNLGGIHSGCGASSIAWLVYALVLMRRDGDAAAAAPMAVQLVASSILILLLASSLAAFPVLRHLHHNVFELVHRFAGWASLALVWAFIFLVNSYNSTKKAYVLQSSILLSREELWFTCAITLLIITPWLCLQRVAIQTIVPSSNVSIIKFPGNGIKPGLLTRISRSPLLEWHAFGTISNGKQGHMVLAGAVGDFTKNLVTEPPTHIWVRCLHFAGLSYLANMFHKVLFVATGSGICVFLSFLLQHNQANIYLIWITKSIENTYGLEFTSLVRTCPNKCLWIYDTTVEGGRPNVKDIVVTTAKKWGAEVVIVTSNPSGTKDVVDSCRAHNIPAFGPIWDS